MSVYKVLARCPWRKVQQIKKIYESDIKFEKWGKQYAIGCQFRHNVEVYKMTDEKYELIYTLKMPINEEDIKQYVLDNNMYIEEVKWRLRDLEDTKKYFKNVYNKEL